MGVSGEPGLASLALLQLAVPDILDLHAFFVLFADGFIKLFGVLDRLGEVLPALGSLLLVSECVVFGLGQELKIAGPQLLLFELGVLDLVPRGVGHGNGTGPTSNRSWMHRMSGFGLF